MKITKTLAAAMACAALVACSSGDDEAVNADANLTDMNAGMTDMNADMNMDMNAGMDANMTVNAGDGMNATENAVVNDLTTNAPDANLANGM